MASLKNSPGEYCLQQREFNQQKKYLHYKYSQVPLHSKLPGLGINAGNMRGGYFNKVLLIILQILKVIYMELDKLI